MANYFKYRPILLDENGWLSNESHERVIAPVSESYYYLPNRSQLNDPTEGVFVNSINESVASYLQGVTGLGEVQQLKKSLYEFMNQIDSTNDRSGVYSLTSDPVDELMWAHYANSHHGIAIEYEHEKLIRFSADYRTHSFTVSYSKAPPKMDLPMRGENASDIINLMLGNKSSKWCHEKEYRIVIDGLSGKVPHDCRAIKSITFGARVKQPVRDEVYELTKHRVPEFYEIVMPPNVYEFERHVIESMVGSHPQARKYEIDWSEHLQSIPREREAEFRDLMEGIVMNDPHFKQLMTADLVKVEDEYVLLMYEVEHKLDIENPANFVRHSWSL